MSITYRQDDAERRVDIDTRQALAGLHLPPLEPVASDQGAGAAPEAQGAANAPGM